MALLARSNRSAPQFWPTNGPILADRANNGITNSPSIREAMPNPATVSWLKLASRLTTMAVEIGPIRLVAVAGMLIESMRRQERHTSSSVRSV